MNAITRPILNLAAHNQEVLPLAVALGETLCKLDPEVPEELVYAVLVLAHKLADSDVCVRLEEQAFEPVVQQWYIAGELPEQSLYCYVTTRFTDFGQLRKRILSCHTLVGTQDSAVTPLICCTGRLYLRRYFLYERIAAAFVAERQQQVVNFSKEQEDKLKTALEVLFGKATPGQPEWQKIAALCALRSKFTVITGGPGTGKTTTVTKILLLLLSLSAEKLQIRLCAPTGKAAEHMNHSLSQAVHGREFSGWVEKLQTIFSHSLDLKAIPESAETLHSLLRVIPHRSSVRVTPKNPLLCDVLVVDEVSMVDLPMFAKLCQALTPRTRLILLGDKDQLFSVESGSVLSDLCSELRAPSAAGLDFFSRLSGHDPADFAGASLSDSTVFLTRSHRFSGQSGIGRLAAAVNANDRERSSKMQTILNCFEQGFADLKLALQPGNLQGQALWQEAVRIARESISDPALSLNLRSYRGFLAELKQSLAEGLSLKDAQRLFARLDEYRILCSNRKGVLGQDNLNRLISNEVRQELRQGGGQGWFAGRVILITKNNRALTLSNGDVGFVAYLRDEEQSGRKDLMVFFKGSGEEARAVRPVFLTDYEDGYAMTVHKSQGSEYQEVLLVLSPYDNPVLTKELVYTGITRARERLCLSCSLEILGEACMRRVQRESGLPLWLRGEQPRD